MSTSLNIYVSVPLCVDLPGLSDEEGSSEVFLTTDSDYDSSRAQSPRELDLLPSSPGVCGRVGSAVSAGSRPDVVQLGGGLLAGRGRSGSGGIGAGVGACVPEAFDSDFILPSRQIELLRITEKRQALCVRTSSLECPPTSASSCAANATSPDRRYRGSHAQSRPARPTRAHSEDSGVRRLSAPSSSSSSASSSWHTTLRIYPQYPTGLPKETSVKVPAHTHTNIHTLLPPPSLTLQFK